MKKTILTLLLGVGMALGAHAQLLYKISGDSIAKPSYIFATNAMMNPLGIVDNVAGLKEALTQTEQMYFDANKEAYRDVINDAKKLDGGKKLTNLLTPVQTKLLDAFLKKYMEVGLSSPYVQKKYGNLTPAAVLEELEQLLFVANHMGEYDPTNSFDQYFEAQAKANSDPVYGLVEADHYIKCRYQAPMEKQVEALMGFLENQEAALAKMNKVAAGFKAQDMDAVAAAVGSDACAHRNAKWAEKISQVSSQKPTFYVVDAIALGGPDGLLQLLQKAGYAVEGVR